RAVYKSRAGQRAGDPGKQFLSARCENNGARCALAPRPLRSRREEKRRTGLKSDGHLEALRYSRVGDPCLRSSDCPDSSCCARHFWARICKPVLQEGQVCTRHRHKGTRGLELFQRCSCGDGLTCRTLRGPDSQPPSLASSSSSPSLMDAAAKSKFASSRHSSGQMSSSSSAKTRLHVCQKK
uniref:Dickkopf N-terminal cysteine-rich domain-containing protein n=1 Tax=Amphiprion percula TaxID=161767 RepID=A0A3P8TSV1_AMPPE